MKLKAIVLLVGATCAAITASADVVDPSEFMGYEPGGTKIMLR